MISVLVQVQPIYFSIKHKTLVTTRAFFNKTCINTTYKITGINLYAKEYTFYLINVKRIYLLCPYIWRTTHVLCMLCPYFLYGCSKGARKGKKMMVCLFCTLVTPFFYLTNRRFVRDRTLAKMKMSRAFHALLKKTKQRGNL